AQTPSPRRLRLALIARPVRASKKIAGEESNASKLHSRVGSACSRSSRFQTLAGDTKTCFVSNEDVLTVSTPLDDHRRHSVDASVRTGGSINSGPSGDHGSRINSGRTESERRMRDAEIDL